MSAPADASPVTGFRSAVDALRRLNLTGLSGPELLELLRELEAQKNRLAAVDQALLAEIDSRQVAQDVNCRDTAALLVDVLRVDPAEARRRVNDMSDFTPRVMPTGAVVEPTVPAAAAAIADGTISLAHARHIATFTDHLPAHITPAVKADLQERLVQDARHTHPRRGGQLPKDYWPASTKTASSPTNKNAPDTAASPSPPTRTAGPRSPATCRRCSPRT